MPRNEAFLDPGAGPLASFAWDLRALRERAGSVPYRVLAKRAGFCASTLSVAASGTKLPSLDVTLAYVQACGADPEEWRARWQELAVQHLPTAQPAPDAHAGLEFAPPYDDERAEDDERGEPAPAAEDRVPVVERDDARTGPAAETAALPAPTATASNGGPRRRSRFPVMSIGRVTTAALTVATAVLGLRVALPASTGNAPVTGPLSASASPAGTAMQQADALYELIYQFTPLRSDVNGAIWDVNTCRDLSNAQTSLRSIAHKRREQVDQLAKLDVSKLPDHAALVAALRHAWLTSAQSDTAYADIAADLQTGCTSGAIRTDPNYQQADADAQAASAAKTEAAQLWNANADALGQLHITKDWL